MKKLKTLPSCKKIILCNGFVNAVFQDKILIFDDEETSIPISEDIDITNVKCFSRFLLLSNNKDLFYLDGKVLNTLKGGGALRSSIILASYIYIPQKVDGIYRFFLFNKELKKREEILYLLNFGYNNMLFYYDDKHVKRYVIDKKEVTWQIDISGHGKSIDYKGDDCPNEIGGMPMGVKNMVYIPLKGGQLLAVDSKLGEKVWYLDHKFTGKYVVFEDKIYKKNKILYEINSKTGDVTQHLNIELYKEGCFSYGPLWVYDDIIILIDILRGGIMMLARTNFEVLDTFFINTSIANRRSAIIWHNQTLYVMDADNNLHIFER